MRSLVQDCVDAGIHQHVAVIVKIRKPFFLSRSTSWWSILRLLSLTNKKSRVAGQEDVVWLCTGRVAMATDGAARAVK